MHEMTEYNIMIFIKDLLAILNAISRESNKFSLEDAVGVR